MKAPDVTAPNASPVPAAQPTSASQPTAAAQPVDSKTDPAKSQPNAQSPPQVTVPQQPVNTPVAPKAFTEDELNKLAKIDKEHQGSVIKQCAKSGVAQYIMHRSGEKPTAFSLNSRFNINPNVKCSTCFDTLICGDEHIQVNYEPNNVKTIISIASIPQFDKCDPKTCPIKETEFTNEGLCISIQANLEDTKEQVTHYFCYKNKNEGKQFKTNLIRLRLSNENKNRYTEIEEQIKQVEYANPLVEPQTIKLPDYRGAKPALPKVRKPFEIREMPVSSQPLQYEKCRIFESDGFVKFHFKKDEELKSSITVISMNLDTLVVKNLVAF